MEISTPVILSSLEILAVADEVSQLTYAELSGQSDLLAHKLIYLGVKPDDFVCIMLDRVKEFPLWVIGIMKAGAASLAKL